MTLSVIDFLRLRDPEGNDSQTKSLEFLRHLQLADKSSTLLLWSSTTTTPLNNGIISQAPIKINCELNGEYKSHLGIRALLLKKPLIF